LEAVFILLEFPSPSRRIFIGSHSLPPLRFAVSVLHATRSRPCAPTARQGGTADAPSGEVHLARGLNAPSGEVRLARGLNAPSVRTASLEGTCMHVVPAPAPVYGHLTL
jgi:hypothetical protein